MLLYSFLLSIFLALSAFTTTISPLPPPPPGKRPELQKKGGKQIGPRTRAKVPVCYGDPKRGGEGNLLSWSFSCPPSPQPFLSLSLSLSFQSCDGIAFRNHCRRRRRRNERLPRVGGGRRNKRRKEELNKSGSLSLSLSPPSLWYCTLYYLVVVLRSSNGAAFDYPPLPPPFPFFPLRLIPFIFQVPFLPLSPLPFLAISPHSLFSLSLPSQLFAAAFQNFLQRKGLLQVERVCVSGEGGG